MIQAVGGRRSRHLWLVRHGESTWNAQGRMQRQVSHPPLTARGTMQAYAAGYSLQDKQIERIVSSDAVRAIQTAQAMATILGAETVIDKRLRERGWSDAGRLVSASSRTPEHLEDPTERIQAALLHIAASDCPTVVVTHGDIVCAVLDLLGERDAATATWATGTDVPNGVVLQVRLRRLIQRPDRT
ncbi:MAG: histidine phosphatase family protein [Mycobacterium sp.]